MALQCIRRIQKTTCVFWNCTRKSDILFIQFEVFNAILPFLFALVYLNRWLWNIAPTPLIWGILDSRHSRGTVIQLIEITPCSTDQGFTTCLCQLILVCYRSHQS